MLVVHDRAAEDLKELKAVEPKAYLRLVVFLDQLRKDAFLQSSMLTHGFGEEEEDDQRIGVKKWIDVQRKEHMPVWRLRVWELEAQGLNYRIVYFYYWPEKTFYVTAVCHRDHLDYDDPKNAIRRRVVRTITDEFPNA